MPERDASRRAGSRQLSARLYLAGGLILIGLPLAGYGVSSWISARKRVAEECFRRPLLALAGHEGPVWSVVFSPAGRRALAGSADGTVRLWDLEGGKETLKLAGHTDWISAIAVSPDGRRAFSGGGDGAVRAWDLPFSSETTAGHRSSGGGGDDKRSIRRLAKYGSPIRIVAISLDGGRALSEGKDGMLRLWDLEGGREILRLAGYEGFVNSVAF